MPTTYDFTAERISALRDAEQLSWAKVAEALSLGSPGAARRAYSALVRPHTESLLLCSGYGPEPAPTPVDLANATKTKLDKTIVGKIIVVQRRTRTEDIYVAKVTSIKAGTINFNDGDKARSVKADAVVAVR